MDFSFVTEPERAVRNAHRKSTLFATLRKQFSEDEILSATASGADLRSIALVSIAQEGTGEPLLGVQYGGDFRAEEEWGMRFISEALSDGSATSQAGIFEGQYYLAFQGARGANRLDSRVLTEALHRRQKPPYYAGRLRDERMTVPELRAALKDAGVEQKLPRTKRELHRLYVRIVRNVPDGVDVGEFHYGDWLVMMAHDPVLQVALQSLSERFETLSAGGGTTPFGRSLTFFDERDLTAETVEALRRHERFATEAMPQVSDVRERLKANGSLYFLGHPRLGDSSEVTYWLNYAPRGHKQVYGWLTLSQLEEIAGK